jgi:hypothetical protein
MDLVRCQIVGFDEYTLYHIVAWRMALARRRPGTAEKASAAPSSHYHPGNKRSEMLPLRRSLAAYSALVPAGGPPLAQYGRIR